MTAAAPARRAATRSASWHGPGRRASRAGRRRPRPSCGPAAPACAAGSSTSRSPGRGFGERQHGRGPAPGRRRVARPTPASDGSAGRPRRAARSSPPRPGARRAAGRVPTRRPCRRGSARRPGTRPPGVTTVPPVTADAVAPWPRPGRPGRGRRRHRRRRPGRRPGPARGLTGPDHQPGDEQPLDHLGGARRVGQRPVPVPQLEDRQVRLPAGGQRADPALPPHRRGRGRRGGPDDVRERPSRRAAAWTAWSPGRTRARRRCARAGRWRSCPGGNPWAIAPRATR